MKPFRFEPSVMPGWRWEEPAAVSEGLVRKKLDFSVILKSRYSIAVYDLDLDRD